MKEDKTEVSKELKINNILFDAINLGADKLKNFFTLDIETIEEKPKHVIELQYKMAKLTCDLIREHNIQKRTETGMKIRIYHLSAEDKPAFKEMITEGLPSYSL